MAKQPSGPKWIDIARKYIGLTEISGKRHNATILSWWDRLKLPFTDDETPWCAGFVGGVLEEAGKASTRSAAARSYLKYGLELSKPCYGAIVIFWRGSPSGWSGHVGFVVGQDQRGNLMVLGGNQGNAVNIKAFGRNRVLGYRWPGIAPYPERYDLPVLNSDGSLSQNEA